MECVYVCRLLLLPFVNRRGCIWDGASFTHAQFLCDVIIVWFLSTENMAVLEKLPVNAVFHVGVVLPLGTILLCYTVATLLGHVPVWLPMISDCAVYPPEKYPFRWGIVLSAALFALQSVLLYGADRPYSRSKVALFFGLLTAFCLSVVGVVNEVENNTIHSSKDLLS